MQNACTTACCFMVEITHCLPPDGYKATNCTHTCALAQFYACTCLVAHNTMYTHAHPMHAQP